MLYTMKALLSVAKEHRFAVPAFNISSYEILKAIMSVCQNTNSPVILEVHPSELEYLGPEFIESLRAFANNATVPVVLHCDHGAEMKDIMQAIQLGYTSVMIDASHDTFEENIRKTKEVVTLAHSIGISVEAELGTIGDTGNSYEKGSQTIIYTDPQKAQEFVEKTNIDTLAIAIGTAHGKYPKDWIPRLDITRLKQLNQIITIPMVLHGGSGNPDSEVSESVQYGVGKVNISTDLKTVFFDTLKGKLNADPNTYEPMAVYPDAIKAVERVVEHKLEILGTLGKASLYSSQ